MAERKVILLSYFKGDRLRNLLSLLKAAKKTDTVEIFFKGLNTLLSSGQIPETELTSFLRVKETLEELPDRMLLEAIEVFGKDEYEE